MKEQLTRNQVLMNFHSPFAKTGFNRIHDVVPMDGKQQNDSQPGSQWIPDEAANVSSSKVLDEVVVGRFHRHGRLCPCWLIYRKGHQTHSQF